MKCWRKLPTGSGWYVICNLCHVLRKKRVTTCRFVCTDFDSYIIPCTLLYVHVYISVSVCTGKPHHLPSRPNIGRNSYPSDVESDSSSVCKGYQLDWGKWQGGIQKIYLRLGGHQTWVQYDIVKPSVYEFYVSCFRTTSVNNMEVAWKKIDSCSIICQKQVQQCTLTCFSGHEERVSGCSW